MIKYLFKRDTILVSVLVFVVMGLLSLIPVNTHVLDPIKLALEDFDYNDLAYSQFNKNAHTPVDTSIVIVNISDAARPEIAAIVNAAARQGAKAIGVDVLFNEAKDSGTDALLQEVFARNNVVLAYNLIKEKTDFKQIGFLYTYAKHKGFANFVGEETGVIRHFAPAFTKKENFYLSFPAAIARVAYPLASQELLAKNKQTLQVNYTRAKDKFIVLEGRDILQPGNRSALANKIVLIGFVANDPYSIEDKHFTPFNKKSVGKSVPDMEGIFVHANIISMIRDGAYVKKSPVWINWLIASLLCWFHVALFTWYFLDNHLWFHLVAKLAQVVSAVLFVYLGLLFYFKWDVKINLTPTFVAIILAVDVLYFYEAFMAWLHKKFGVHSIFVKTHH